MAIKFANNATTTLAGSLTAGATSMTVQTGDGAKFPTLSGSDFFLVTLVKIVAGAPVYEIVKVTARAGDVFTIVRGQEGTTATAFSVLDRVENRLTRDTMEVEVTKNASNNTFTGNNTFNGTSTFNNDITVVGGVITEAEGAPVPSAATTDIWAGSDGNTKHITGTTTITSFGTAPQAGAWMKVIFDAALTLTHSANLNLNNNGNNVNVAAGDMAMVYADTTTQMDVFIQRANGQPVADITPSGMTLLATLTPAAAANLDALNIITSLYDSVLIVVNGVRPASGTPSLQMRIAIAGAAHSGSNYNYTTTPGGAITTGQTQWPLIPAPTSGTPYYTGSAELWNVRGGSGVSKAGRGIGAVDNSAASNMASYSYHLAGAPGGVSGFRFFWSGGQNFDLVGNIQIYGYRNT